MKTTIDGIDYPIPAPHCDPQVLHAPGVCRYCDAYPKWQTKRTVAKMLFTGELPREGWQPCAAEKARGMDSPEILKRLAKALGVSRGDLLA